MGEQFTEPLTRIEGLVNRLRLSLTWVFLVALLASLVIAWNGWHDGSSLKTPDSWSRWRYAQVFTTVAWIVMPPIWFWVEYFFGPWAKQISYGDSPATRFDRLKYGQDVSSKIWLGVSTVLLMLYFGKDIK